MPVCQWQVRVMHLYNTATPSAASIILVHGHKNSRARVGSQSSKNTGRFFLRVSRHSRWHRERGEIASNGR